jgi:cysteine desulfurase
MHHKKRIYLDHGASTPVHPVVLEAMLPFWTEIYGNPSSSHDYGRSAESALEKARNEVAELINAQPDEIVFTGCGSESDNLAIRGVMWALRAGARQGDHMIVSAIEHSAVLNTVVQLRDHFGFELTILPVNGFGQVSLADLEASIRPNTGLISIMAANNEIGSLQPILEIGEIAREHDALFHTDAIQAAPIMRWDMAVMPIDLMSIAPHKFYGPKGVGILYVRRGIDLLSATTGGSQENDRRAGTSNVAFAVGAAKAFQLAMAGMEERNAHYRSLRDRLIEGTMAALPGVCRLTGHPTDRLPHNASFAFRNVSGNDLLIHLDVAGIAASSGSACKVGDPKPSATLQAIGLGDEWTKGGLRLTVGSQNTPEEIEYVLAVLPDVVQRLRQLDKPIT